MTTEDAPVQVVKKAIDVTPYKHGIWCRIAGGAPFVNEIAMRKWSDDGRQIIFMLESHNFDFRDPDEEMSVVEIEPAYGAAFLAERLERDAADMAKRPHPSKECPMCNGKGRVSL